jgi:hypothetical protein
VKPLGVRVGSVRPGTTITNLSSNLFPDIPEDSPIKGYIRHLKTVAEDGMKAGFAQTPGIIIRK